MNIIDDIKLQYKIGGIANRVIYWNVAVFLVSILFFYRYKLGIFEYPNWLVLSSKPTDLVYFPWTLLTYSFLHAGFWHLFFNMMVLNFSSRLFLTFFTQKQFLGLYLLSAIFSGLFFVVSFYFLKINSPLVGASASVMAILVATTTYHPLLPIKLFFVGQIKLWHLTALVLILDLMRVQLDNTGGHIAHLSAALFGFLYIKLLLNGYDFSKIVSYVIDLFTNLFQPKKKTPFKKVYTTPHKVRTDNKKSTIIIKNKTQQQIDDILDKISKSGYESLNAEEKDFLFRAGKE
jgi:membrane associated rhomboid family serine protease